MASNKSTMEFLADQISSAGIITYKKMFGEYGIYCNEKIVAFLCDDELFIKPNDGAKNFLKQYEEKPPYKGAKPYIFIPGELWDDSNFLSSLIKISAESLPLKKACAKKKNTL